MKKIFIISMFLITIFGVFRNITKKDTEVVKHYYILDSEKCTFVVDDEALKYYESSSNYRFDTPNGATHKDWLYESENYSSVDELNKRNATYISDCKELRKRKAIISTENYKKEYLERMKTLCAEENIQDLSASEYVSCKDLKLIKQHDTTTKN